MALEACYETSNNLNHADNMLCARPVDKNCVVPLIVGV